MVSAQRCEQGTEGKHQTTVGQQSTKAAEAVAGAVDKLLQQNDDIIKSAAYFVAEVGELEHLQQRACGSVADKIDTSFSPEVLDILKGNADQLFQLKQEVVADKLAAKESAKKMMLWMSGSAGSQEQHSSNAAAGQPTGSDAVKQRGFKPLQLPGSSIAAVQAQSSGSTWQALKFWQVGVQHNKQTTARTAAAADTPGVADQQQQMQKSLSSMLFGKQKRQSSGGADATSRRLSIDPAASWRSSVDGSLNGRRASARSSDAGVAMIAAAAAAAAGAAAGSGSERGAVMSSLAAGEGPLSKSHSMLATKPGTQQEQILGKSLEIVAEDEREGRDSPAPAEPPGRRLGSVGQPRGLAPIRVPRGSLTTGNRPGSPVDSFSFGPRAEEEQAHSPSFLRSSVSSRMGQQAGATGPLVRSSMALRASMVARVDPFEAPEPEPQPFVEQLRAEQQEGASGGGAQGGIMAALRRSISGAGSNSRRTPRQSVEGAAWGGSQLPPRQPQQLTYQQPQQQQQQLQQASDAGSMQFLDLDATRAYALGVHQVMMRLEQGMQSQHSQSEASSKPASPRVSAFAEAAAVAAAAAAEGPAAGAHPVPAYAVDGQAPSAQQSLQQLEEEASEEDQQQRQPARASGGDVGPADIGPMTSAAYADAAAMPPLRSGMSSPAASRRQTLVTGPPAAARQLPLMGQASMEILTKPQHQQQGVGASRHTSLVGASTTLSLADVYKQTSGNLTPLSSHLSGIGRRSSSNANKVLAAPQPGMPSRAASGGLGVSTSRSILGEAGPQAGAVTSGALGPLSMLYGSTMQQAKKSAHAAGLAAGAPDQRQMQVGWQGAPGAVAAAAAAAAVPEAAGMDPAAFAANNKYASSWGILDAGGLSRQSSMNGAQMSRLPSGSVRASPQASGTDDGTWQQQRPRGAAGRYAGTSLTPGSQSPRSGAVTPSREDNSVGMGMPGQQSSAGRRRAPAGAGGRQGEQAATGRGAQGRDGSTAGSDDFESAEEQLSSGASGMSALSGPYGSTSGGAGRLPSATGGLPHPPAFLSGNPPTCAQAAVATQWSPSKSAAAFAQAPAYMRQAVLRISPEVSGTSLGLAPQGLQDNNSRGVSPREGNTGPAMSQSVNGPSRISSSSIGASRTSQTSGYEGGYNIYAPLDPPMARSQSGRQQQQQQPVVTAVDMARRQSHIRRASSQGGDYITGLSSNGRTSSSNIGYTQGSFQQGQGGGAYGTFGGRSQQQQQQYGQGNMHSAGIYGTIRPQQWQQRQQYRL